VVLLGAGGRRLLHAGTDASGVSCLFVPRALPTASNNRFLIQRLKDKCGNRSNASSEIEYRDTWAMLVGEEGRGIREILSHCAPDAARFRGRLGGSDAPCMTLATTTHSAPRFRQADRRAADAGQCAR
jgi:putative acyl-CoA dehydrogenase